MARSTKHHPIGAISKAESEKQDKRAANRSYRHAVKQSVVRGDELLPVMQEVSNISGFAKDGKRWCATDPKALRK